jgi:hypothetical protein
MTVGRRDVDIGGVGMTVHDDRERGARSHSARWWYALLLLPLVGLLYPPLYAYDDPQLWGIPFFYWYQFAWVPVTGILVAIVYRMTRSER